MRNPRIKLAAPYTGGKLQGESFLRRLLVTVQPQHTAETHLTTETS